MRERLYIPKEVFDAFRDSLQTLHECVAAEENPEKQIAYRKMLTNVDLNGEPFQVIIEICTDPQHFIPDGDIEIITHRAFHDEPYKVIEAIKNGQMIEKEA